MSESDPSVHEIKAIVHLAIDDLSNSQKHSIRNALQTYRDTVLQHNLSLLKRIIPQLETDPDLEDKDLLDHFPHHLFQGPLPNSVNNIQDLLLKDTRKEYIETQELDGVAHGPADRTQWFGLMQEGILTRRTDVHVAPFPPPELEYLCTLVPAIIGAGLPFYRSFERVAFLSALNAHESPSETRARISFPLTDLDSALSCLWNKWEIAVVCKIGANPERSWSGSYVLWCRCEEEGREWKWRYGLHDESWESEIFDTIEEFLGWYARHGATGWGGWRGICDSVLC